MRAFVFSLLRFQDISNTKNNTLIGGTSGNDSIHNIKGNKVTLEGGNGNDTIYNEGAYDYGDNVLVLGGAGNDSISNHYGADLTLSGGNGNDTIKNNDRSNSINGGAGNDVILNTAFNNLFNGHSLTVEGGAGNDYIENNGGNYILFKYASGDGNDTIQGFNANSTLSISGGSYSTTKSNSNVIVTVDTGKITLVGAASLSTVNIKGTKAQSTGKTLSSSAAGTSLVGGSGNDNLYISHDNVTASGGSGNDTIYSSSENNSINGGAGNDLITYYSTVGGSDWILGGDGNDTLRGTFTSADIHGGYGNDIISLSSNSEDNYIFYDSGYGNDTIYNLNENEIYLNKGGKYTCETIGNDVVVSLVGGGSMTLKNAKGKNIGIVGGTLNVNSGGKTLKSSASNTSLVGGKENDSLYIGHYSVTASGGAGNDTIYNDTAWYAKIYGGDGNDIIHNFQGDYSHMFGGNGDDSIYNKTWYNTIDAGNGNDTIINYQSGKDTSINGGAGNDLISLHSASYANYSHTIKGGKGNDTIYGNSSPDSLYGSTYQFSSGDGFDIICNFTKYDKISLGGGEYTRETVGNDVIVSLVGGGSMTLKKAKGKTINIVGGTNVDDNSWKLNGTTATYGTASKTLVTVSGVKSTGGLSLNNKVVTVANSSLNAKKVTISDGYTLKLGDDVNTPSTTKAWSFKDSTATYKQTKSAGYTLAGNSKSITYSKSSSTDLITVSGVKSKDGLSVNGKVVTVSNAALNQKKVTISNGYTLKLGSDVTKSKSTAVGWTKSGSTATYKAASTTAGYTLANNQISYVKASGGATLATVKGVKNIDGLSVNNKVVTLKKSSLADKITLGGSYSFNLAAGNYNKTSVMGSTSADVITSNGKNLSINGGKGNDTINVFGTGTTVTGGKGNDVFIYSGGNGRITDFGATDTLRIGNGTGTYSSETSGKNLIVTVGDNKLTLTGAANLSSPNIAGTKKNDDEGVIQNGKKVTLTEDYSSENFTFADDSSMLTVDASAVALDINITGNRFINSILGGAGNDTLIGGKGNDKLDGGEGADIFVYTTGDGNDTILNYTEEDRISIASGTVNGSIFSTSGNDVIVKVGSGKITVKDAKNTIVTCADKAGNEIGYRNGVVIKGDTVTLTGKYANTKFNVNDYTDYNGDIREINASAVQHKLNISGSENSDLIIGGNGDDVILNYKETDAISIASGAVGGNVDYDGKDVIFHINGGSITVEGGNGSKITFIDKDGKSNGKIYKSTGMWFVEDDTNFDNADNQLGSIVKDSASIYSFDTSKDLMSLTSKDTFIAYSDK